MVKAIFTIVCPSCGRVHYSHDSYCAKVADCSSCIERKHLEFMRQNPDYTCVSNCICGRNKMITFDWEYKPIDKDGYLQIWTNDGVILLSVAEAL